MIATTIVGVGISSRADGNDHQILVCEVFNTIQLGRGDEIRSRVVIVPPEDGQKGYLTTTDEDGKFREVVTPYDGTGMIEYRGNRYELLVTQLGSAEAGTPLLGFFILPPLIGGGRPNIVRVDMWADPKRIYMFDPMLFEDNVGIGTCEPS